MTPSQRSLARHALGLPTDRMRSYRNRYIAGNEHPAYPDWVKMVQAKYAGMQNARDYPLGRNRLFYLTHAGALLALDPGELLDREDFPEESR